MSREADRRETRPVPAPSPDTSASCGRLSLGLGLGLCSSLSTRSAHVIHPASRFRHHLQVKTPKSRLQPHLQTQTANSQPVTRLHVTHLTGNSMWPNGTLCHVPPPPSARRVVRVAASGVSICWKSSLVPVRPSPPPHLSTSPVATWQQSDLEASPDLTPLWQAIQWFPSRFRKKPKSLFEFTTASSPKSRPCRRRPSALATLAPFCAASSFPTGGHAFCLEHLPLLRRAGSFRHSDLSSSGHRFSVSSRSKGGRTLLKCMSLPPDKTRTRSRSQTFGRGFRRHSHNAPCATNLLLSRGPSAARGRTTTLLTNHHPEERIQTRSPSPQPHGYKLSLRPSEHARSRVEIGRPGCVSGTQPPTAQDASKPPGQVCSGNKHTQEQPAQCTPSAAHVGFVSITEMNGVCDNGRILPGRWFHSTSDHLGSMCACMCVCAFACAHMCVHMCIRVCVLGLN